MSEPSTEECWVVQYRSKDGEWIVSGTCDTRESAANHIRAGRRYYLDVHAWRIVHRVTVINVTETVSE
jgi:hypothetical protein